MLIGCQLAELQDRDAASSQSIIENFVIASRSLCGLYFRHDPCYGLRMCRRHINNAHRQLRCFQRECARHTRAASLVLDEDKAGRGFTSEYLLGPLEQQSNHLLRELSRKQDDDTRAWQARAGLLQSLGKGRSLQDSHLPQAGVLLGIDRPGFRYVSRDIRRFHGLYGKGTYPGIYSSQSGTRPFLLICCRQLGQCFCNSGQRGISIFCWSDGRTQVEGPRCLRDNLPDCNRVQMQVA